MDTDKRVSALENRVAELEERLAEAGRRALFALEKRRLEIGEQNYLVASDYATLETLADLGRALLFDPETPDERGDETPT